MSEASSGPCISQRRLAFDFENLQLIEKNEKTGGDVEVIHGKRMDKDEVEVRVEGEAPKHHAKHHVLAHLSAFHFTQRYQTDEEEEHLDDVDDEEQGLDAGCSNLWQCPGSEGPDLGLVDDELQEEFLLCRPHGRPTARLQRVTEWRDAA